MNYIKIIIISIFVLIAPTSLAQVKEQLKVMSFNIHYGTLTTGEFNISKAAEVIKNNNPDVVLLQEVDNKTKRSKRKDLATELACKTDMAPIFGKSISYQGGAFGNAILTKYPVMKSEVHLLPFVAGTEQRSVLEALISINNDEVIRVASTHFDHLEDNRLRVKQSEYLNKILNDSIPTVLAGDLNAPPNTEEIGVFRKDWNFSFKDSAFTFPSEEATKKIDYILTRPLGSWKLVKAEIIKDSITSDHFPILTTLELLGNAGVERN